MNLGLITTLVHTGSKARTRLWGVLYLASKPMPRRRSASSRTRTSRVFTQLARSSPSAFLRNMSSRRPGVATMIFALSEEIITFIHSNPWIKSKSVMFYQETSVCVCLSVSIHKPLALELLHIVNRIVATNQKNLSANGSHFQSRFSTNSGLKIALQ